MSCNTSSMSIRRSDVESSSAAMVHSIDRLRLLPGTMFAVDVSFLLHSAMMMPFVAASSVKSMTGTSESSKTTVSPFALLFFFRFFNEERTNFGQLLIIYPFLII